MAKEIQIDSMITVGTLAEKLDIPATKLIGELFKNGMMVTINEKIDADTAQIIIEELGLEVNIATKATDQEDDSTNEVTKRAMIRMPRPDRQL